MGEIGEESNGNVDRRNVLDLAARLARAQGKPLYFTDEERKEIREMLAYYRIARPQFEAMKRGCPTARFLLGEE